MIREIVDAWAYTPHIRSRSEEKRQKENNPRYQARRWVVERTQLVQQIPALWFDEKRKSLIISPYSNWPLI